MSGSLITFEGIDFSGKSVQSERLVQRLKSRRVPVVLLRDPGGTAISERIRSLLLDSQSQEIFTLTEFFLYSAARAQMVAEQILPGLSRGDIVICDRFYDSTTAYQGYGRGIDLELIKRVNHAASQGIRPVLTFVLDIEPEQALLRRGKLKGELDRMEEQDIDFFRRVRRGYLEIAQTEPERVIILNGKKSIVELESEIWNMVSYRLKLT